MKQYPVDGGPIYVETNLEAFISEPWNALSSLAIVLPSIYWAFKLKGDFKKYGFIFFLIPLLFLGGMGSTFFHAFRSSSFMLWMDVLPTAIVTFSVGIYFWNKVMSRWWHVVVTVIPLTAFRFLLWTFLPGGLATNLSYLIAGILIFLPVILYLKNQGYRHFQPITISIISLSLSLFFRRFDFFFEPWLPMGSHFLWHVLSGIGAFYLAKFLVFIRNDELNQSTIYSDR